MSTKKTLSDAPGAEAGEFDVRFVEGELGMRLEERGSFDASSVVVRITEDGEIRFITRGGVEALCMIRFKKNSSLPTWCYSGLSLTAGECSYHTRQQYKRTRNARLHPAFPAIGGVWQQRPRGVRCSEL